MTFDFIALWLSGRWRRLGKDEAKRRFEATVRTQADWLAIQCARDAYNDYCARNQWYTPQLGSVWFGNRKGWRDWVPEERTEAIVDELPLLHLHMCELCDEPHGFTFADCPHCNVKREVACPQFAGRYMRK